MVGCMWEVVCVGCMCRLYVVGCMWEAVCGRLYVGGCMCRLYVVGCMWEVVCVGCMW